MKLDKIGNWSEFKLKIIGKYARGKEIEIMEGSR